MQRMYTSTTALSGRLYTNKTAQWLVMTTGLIFIVDDILAGLRKRRRHSWMLLLDSIAAVCQPCHLQPKPRVCRVLRGQNSDYEDVEESKVNKTE